MSTGGSESFEQKGDDVVAAAAKLGEQSSELSDANAAAAEAPEEVGSWITAIGKALLAIFGLGSEGSL